MNSTKDDDVIYFINIFDWFSLLVMKKALNVLLLRINLEYMT